MLHTDEVIKYKKLIEDKLNQKKVEVKSLKKSKKGFKNIELPK